MELGSIDKGGVQSGDIAAIAATDASPKVRNVDASAIQAQEVVKNDAVAVELSASSGLRTDDSAEKADSNDIPIETDKEISAEKAETLRSELEGAINSTQVRFDVSIEKDGKSSLFFQVVDKDSGRVIRQFPPEELVDLGKIAEQLSDHSSSYIDAQA